MQLFRSSLLIVYDEIFVPPYLDVIKIDWEMIYLPKMYKGIS